MLELESYKYEKVCDKTKLKLTLRVDSGPGVHLSVAGYTIFGDVHFF